MGILGMISTDRRKADMFFYEKMSDFKEVEAHEN